MKRTQSGLFSSHISSLAMPHPVTKLVGAYDPTEQLWKDEGTVVACSGPGAFCQSNSDCCPLLGLIALCGLGQCLLN